MSVELLSPAPVRRRSGTGRRTRLMLVGGVVLLALAAGVAVVEGYVHVPSFGAAKPSAGDDVTAPPREPTVTSVKVVRPKRDASVQITVEQIATVEPYYRADLRARASGLVRTVTKAIGDTVKRGDLLVEIDAPEITQEVAQKQAGVVQRQQEGRVSRAMYKDAEAKRAVARTTVRQRQAEVVAAEATADLRRKRYERYRSLAASQSVGPDVVEEQEREMRAGDAAVTAAKVAVERAVADVTEADARVEAAAADIDLKAAMVEVARRDLDRSRAVADFARVYAPFDGVLTRRTVDPGAFVQNATTGASEPLVSVARTDLVTVVARIPDNAAPFVTDETMATITVDGLPGAAITSRVTRFAPSIQNADRTLRVEVDLFNGDDAAYRRMVGSVLAARLAPLAATSPLEAVGLMSRDTDGGPHKGDGDPFPVRVGSDKSARVMPGATANMTLRFGRFGNEYVLPSTAVYSRGGKPYLLLVEDGKTRQVPVRVQVNDGRVVKLAILDRDRSAELTGQELVVVSRQLEVGDSQAVRGAPTDW